MSQELQQALAVLKPLLEIAAEEKDGELWRFPFSRGLRNDMRYGDHWAGPWQLQSVLMEQRRRGGTAELIAALEAAIKVGGGSRDAHQVQPEGSER